MIRITLNAQSDPEIHLFNKSTILIGREQAHVDLVLPDPDIQPVHLQILELNGFPVLVNFVNDPFAAINGHPFGKKLLNSGDVIVVQQYTLLFENLNAPQVDAQTISHETQNALSSPQNQETPLFTSFALPFEHEVKAFDSEEMQNISIENLIAKEHPKENNPPVAPLRENSNPEKQTSRSLKDDYLKDLDDDLRYEKFDSVKQVKEISHLYQAWKWILIFIFSLFAIAAIIGTILYFSVSGKAEAQETKAAQGVADVAMALTHAQLNHIKPHNHNWSDVEFLKSNLQAILPDYSSHALQIDSQGQFKSCSYCLRIYTNSDLSHFLLIAQPAAGLLNWLIPQSLIVVDSRLMELRVVEDVRSLNRLLANPDPLEGNNNKEISALIKKGELIRLSSLAHDSGTIDFLPPKNIASISPDAENLIYNAPRYYRLGTKLLQQAMTLYTSKGSSLEVATLKQDVEALSSLNHLILYSEHGKESALLSAQGMTLFAPSSNLLFGYILFKDNHIIRQAHLLKEEEWKEIATRPPLPREDSLHAPLVQNPEIDPIKTESSSSGCPVDTNHPIYIQLQSLVSAREAAITPLAEHLIHLIRKDLLYPFSEFTQEFTHALEAYTTENAKEERNLQSALQALYHQYPEICSDQLMSFIEAMHLEHLIQKEEQLASPPDAHWQEEVELALKQMETSHSLTDLEPLIETANHSLNWDEIKDHASLIKSQRVLRNRVLAELEKRLLSPNSNFLVKQEEEIALQHILEQDHLIQPEEKLFFLRQFDALWNSEITEEEERF